MVATLRRALLLPLWLGRAVGATLGAYTQGDTAPTVPWQTFVHSCARELGRLDRFWGTRPHPDLSMVAADVLWEKDDPNLEVLPRWIGTGGNLTAPFVDTHVAVRFLGGVSNRSEATAAECSDQVKGLHAAGGVDRKGIWCDLVVRQGDGSLRSRFDLVRSRLDRFVDNGIDVMIVLDNVPWAFVDERSEICQGFGCQYLPPKDPQEFADWVGTLASFLIKAYGNEYASRIRWRLGTETNGPRWGGHGQYYTQVLQSYKLTMTKIVEIIPDAEVGASNWVEVVGPSGNLTANGSDAFQYQFYKALAQDPEVPLDWISVSHYGGHSRRGVNFPSPDYVQRTPYGTAGEFELEAMRTLAARPNATLEVQEWSILNNELQQPTWEPSALGTAWASASATTWMCHGVDRIFHWETGTTLRNTSGDGRTVNFYEQWPWVMAFLELFIGGQARFSTHDLIPDAAMGGASSISKHNNTVAIIESKKEDGYYALIAAVGEMRNATWCTAVPLSTMGLSMLRPLTVSQYTMDSSRSVVETVVRELSGRDGMLLHNDGLPYDFGRLLTPAGFAYAEQPENLERYWNLQKSTFQPTPFEGSLTQDSGTGITSLRVPICAGTVKVVVAKPAMP